MQAHNVVVKTEGHMREEPELFNHVDLVQMLGIVDLETGSTVAGTPANHLEENLLGCLIQHAP